MSDDLLERATAAMRETTRAPAEDPDAAAARARLLRAAASARPRRRFLLKRWLWPLVLALGTSTAMARVTYEYFPVVWNAMVPAALERPAAAAPEAVARRPTTSAQTARRKLAHAPEAPPARVAPEPVEPSPVDLAEAAPSVAAGPPLPARVEAAAKPRAIARRPPVRRRSAPSPVPALAPSEPAPPVAPPESAELQLFRRAMALQRAHDRGAIRAWDDYLRAAPLSALEPEARYNRALALVRAGRNEAARRALLPFARGDYAGFRRAEARALLEALPPSPSARPAIDP